ncbi:hypothetical protein PJP07_31105, partial [Mycobacterium kansasii]
LHQDDGDGILELEKNKTAYEMWFKKKPSVKYFCTFGSKCYILYDREILRKFDAKIGEGIFLGYA